MCVYGISGFRRRGEGVEATSFTGIELAFTSTK